MVRPKVHRRIGKNPKNKCFNKENKKINQNQKPIEMSVDEFEAIRLRDYHNIKQNESAELMGISQPTFHRILNSARKKIAISLIEGIEIVIIGEDFMNEAKKYSCKDCGFQWSNPKKEYIQCPDCNSKNIKLIKNENNKNNKDKKDNVNIPSKNDDLNNIPLSQRKSFGGPGSGKGPSKSCKCSKCGYEAPKIRGFPCRNIKCPKCGIPLCGSKKLEK